MKLSEVVLNGIMKLGGLQQTNSDESKVLKKKLLELKSAGLPELHCVDTIRGIQRAGLNAKGEDVVYFGLVNKYKGTIYCVN